MVRDSKTRSLTQAFQQELVNCYQIIVPASGHTIVHQAVVLNKREHFKLCEAYGANWDQGDLNGVTPLMKAAALNRIHYLERLIELGAELDIKDNRGKTALDYAKMYESLEAMDILN